MQLTDNELNVLAHVVIYPQAWADNAGEKAMLGKVAKYQADYNAHKDDVGYQTRAEREAETIAQEQAEQDALEGDYVYQRKRAYPPLSDFADAYVHAQNGNSDYMTAYVAACNQVKADYPKPE